MRHQSTSQSGPSKECPMARRKFIKGLYIPGIDGPTETPLRLATDRKAEIERQAKWLPQTNHPTFPRLARPKTPTMYHTITPLLVRRVVVAVICTTAIL